MKFLCFVCVYICFLSFQLAFAQLPISSLRLWVSADSGIVRSGDSVSQWTDLSGSGFHMMQTAPAFQPKYLVNELNGKPVIHFDGADDYLQTAVPVNIFDTSGSFSFFVVVKPGSSQKMYADIFDTDHRSGLNFVVQQNVLATNTFYFVVGEVVLDSTKFQILSLIFNNRTGDAKIFQNGKLRISGSIGPNSTTFQQPVYTRIANWVPGGREFNGKIAELAFYNNDLDSAKIQQMHVYLNEKYQLVDNILPVELAGFSAQTSGNKVRLVWTTITEKNNAGFAVERSLDKMHFSEIGYVRGASASTEIRKYSFVDDPGAGVFYYRLKQKDFDGTTTCSPVAEVSTIAEYDYKLLGNYPNPFNPETIIRYRLAASGKVTIHVFDVLGNQLETLVDEMQSAGNHTVAFRAANYPSGLYFYSLNTAAYKATGKMLLLK